MESKKSKILIIGVTGRFGFELAKASLRAHHPTFGLVREPDPNKPDPIKSEKLNFLSTSGVTLLKGSLQNEASLIEALNHVDIVICAVAAKQVLEQKLLISAIRRVGPTRIKRFLPSEFGSDPDLTRVSGLDHGFYAQKAEIRRLIESEGIPYTYVSCNFFTTVLLPQLAQPGLKKPPVDGHVSIFGDARAVFVKESDVAEFAIRAADDPRTVNKTVYLRPEGNVCSMSELVSMWEAKIGRTLVKNYIDEEEILRRIGEIPYPENMELVFIYSAFVKGDQAYFDVEEVGGLEGTKLYPDIKYTTISSVLDTLL